MIHASVISVAYLLIAGVLAWVLANPFVFVVALLMFGGIMSNIPFGLSMQDSVDTHAEGRPIGFLAEHEDYENNDE